MSYASTPASRGYAFTPGAPHKPQYSSVQQWLESRREGHHPANDLTERSWSTSARQAFGAPGMFDAALPRAGSQISKGYPASMSKGATPLARPQMSPMQFHTSKRPGPGHVAPLAVAPAPSTPMPGYAPPSRAGSARAPLRPSNAFGTPNLPSIPGYAGHSALAEVTPPITELPHPARAAEAAKPAPVHMRASMASLRRDAEMLSAQVPRQIEEKSAPPQILKQVLREGHGAAARKGDTLDVAYIGWFAGQEGLTATSLTPNQIFDKSTNFQFRLGSGDVIPGAVITELEITITEEVCGEP